MSKVVKPALLNFKFKHFESLNSSPGKYNHATLTDCHGRKWHLNLYPGGILGSIPGNIALDIGGVSTPQLKKYTFTLAIRNSSGDVVCELELDGSSSKEILLEKCRNVMDRSQILDKEENILINGALHVDMLVQTKSQETDLPQPSNPLASKILALCETGTWHRFRYIVYRTK